MNFCDPSPPLSKVDSLHMCAYTLPFLEMDGRHRICDLTKATGELVTELHVYSLDVLDFDLVLNH